MFNGAGVVTFYINPHDLIDAVGISFGLGSTADDTNEIIWFKGGGYIGVGQFRDERKPGIVDGFGTGSFIKL